MNTKRDTSLFDDYWQVKNNISTYELFLKSVDEIGTPFLGQNKRLALKELAKKYRDLESKRWESAGEKYHTHGLYSAWVTLVMISALREKVQVALKGEGILEKETCFKAFGEEEVYNHVFYSMITAAMLHDVGGLQKEYEVSASPDEGVIQKFLSNMHMIEHRCVREITKLAQLTDYKEENAVYFDRKGGIKFIPQDVPTQGLIIVIADLLQIGAVDYFDRVNQDLSLPTDTFPPNILLLLAKLIKELAFRLDISKPIDIVPEEMRSRVISIFKDRDKFDWEWPPRDYETGELLVNPEGDIEWKANFFYEYLMTLLQIE